MNPGEPLLSIIVVHLCPGSSKRVVQSLAGVESVISVMGGSNETYCVSGNPYFIGVAVASNEARQERANLVVHQVSESLYMVANDPEEQGMRSGGNTAVFVMSSGGSSIQESWATARTFWP